MDIFVAANGLEYKQKFSDFAIDGNWVSDFDLNYEENLLKSAIVFIDTQFITEDELKENSELLANKLLIYYGREYQVLNISAFEVEVERYYNHYILSYDSNTGNDINGVIVDVMKNLLIDSRKLVVIDKTSVLNYKSELNELVANFHEQLDVIDDKYCVLHKRDSLVIK